MKKIFVIGIFCCLFCFSGCGKTRADKEEERQGKEGYEETYQDGDMIQMSLDENITIDAQINIPEELKTLKMNKVMAHRPKLDEKKVKNLFFKGGEIESREVYDDFKSREFGDYSMISYVGKNGGRLFYEPTSIEYTHTDMDYILNCLFTDPQFSSYNMDHFSQTKELPFASAKEAFQKVKKVLDTLEIPISDEYEVYALDHKQLEKEEKPMDTDGNIIKENKKEKWTKEDDAYYFILHQEVNGVPVEQIGYGDGYEGTGIQETVLSAVYGKKGFLAFSEEWAYLFDETKEEQEILSAQKAVESFQKKCDMLLLEEVWNIDQISLKLLPVFIKDNDYEIRPVWFFEGTSDDQDQQIERPIRVLFDGITGKEIVL